MCGVKMDYGIYNDNVPETLTNEQMQAETAPAVPETLTNEQMQAGSTSSLSNQEAFERGVADIFGLGYALPAVTALAKEGDFVDNYTSERARWVAEGQNEGMRNLGRGFGMVASMGAGSAGLGGVGKAVALPGKIAGAGGTVAASKLAPLAKASKLGAIAAGVGTGAGAALTSTPYVATIAEGRLPSVGEVVGSTAAGAGIGGGLSALGVGVGSGINWLRRFRNASYSPELLSPGYGKQFGGTSGLRQDTDTLRAIKEAVSPSDSTTLRNLISSTDPRRASLLSSAARNPGQRDVVAGAVGAMAESHPATATRFSKLHIAPKVTAAGRFVKSEVGKATKGLGTPSYIRAETERLNKIYSAGIKKLKGQAFDSETVTEALLREGLAPTAVENIVADITNRGTTVFTRGGENIPAKAIAQYIRRVLRPELIDNDEINITVRGLSNLLARSGNKEFSAGWQGFRQLREVSKAFNAGKTGIAAAHQVQDARAALSSTPHSFLSPEVETQARLSGALDGVRKSLDAGSVPELSGSVRSVLSQTHPRLVQAIDDLSYWQGLRRIAGSGVSVNPVSRQNTVARVAGRFAWGLPAGASATTENILRKLGRNYGVREAESLARFLTAAPRDLQTLMQKPLYKRSLAPFATKPVTPSVLIKDTLWRNNDE